MKTLSLWEPWASLIAFGEKQFETRSWTTSYRGPLAIHAARHFTPDESSRCKIEPFKSALARGGIKVPRDFHLGCVLCVVDLVEVYRVEAIRDLVSSKERRFGNYNDGRFAWKLVNVRRFKTPVPLRGQQGMFECPVVLPLGDLIYH